RLPLLSSRVKFRPFLAFGVYLPAHVERGAAVAVGPAPPAYQPGHHQGDDPPPTTRDQPASERVPALDHPLPFLLEAAHAEAGRRLDRTVEVLPRFEPRQQRGECSRRIPPRELGDGGDRERVRGVRGGGRTAQGAVQRRERGD